MALTQTFHSVQKSKAQKQQNGPQETSLPVYLQWLCPPFCQWVNSKQLVKAFWREHWLLNTHKHKADDMLTYDKSYFLSYSSTHKHKADDILSII